MNKTVRAGGLIQLECLPSVGMVRVEPSAPVDLRQKKENKIERGQLRSRRRKEELMAQICCWGFNSHRMPQPPANSPAPGNPPTVAVPLNSPAAVAASTPTCCDHRQLIVQHLSINLLLQFRLLLGIQLPRNAKTTSKQSSTCESTNCCSVNCSCHNHQLTILHLRIDQRPLEIQLLHNTTTTS